MAGSDHDLEQTLSEVSIRGRMAYSLACLRALAESLDVRSAGLDICFEVLAEFCASDDLARWESTALDRIWPVIESGALVEETGLQLLHDLVELAFDDVGRGNLYAGVVGRSEGTLSAALRIANAVSAAGADLPDAQRFLRFPFTELHGWGLPFAADVGH